MALALNTLHVNLSALTSLCRQVLPLLPFSFSCCFHLSSEILVTAWDTPWQDEVQSNAPASAIFLSGFPSLLRHRSSFEGASAYAWAAGAETFKEAVHFPRVVWSSPGCRIKIQDQTKFWLTVTHKETVMGNTCPAARACWQATTTLVPEWERELLIGGPNLVLSSSSQQSGRPKIQCKQKQFSPLADIREGTCLDKPQVCF